MVCVLYQTDYLKSDLGLFSEEQEFLYKEDSQFCMRHQFSKLSQSLLPRTPNLAEFLMIRRPGGEGDNSFDLNSARACINSFTNQDLRFLMRREGRDLAIPILSHHFSEEHACVLHVV